MPIQGLTDRDSLTPRLERFGKLRKGGEKQGDQWGEDLDYFRMTSTDPQVVEDFSECYGDEPRMVNILLWYVKLEENFSTWKEVWGKSGLTYRSDGVNWLIWRDGNKYSRVPKPHTSLPGEQEVGRLEFLIPEMLEKGYVGTFTMETHSNHDLRNIANALLAAEQERGTLRGAQFVMRRVLESITTPGWGDHAGERVRVKKWLVRLKAPKRFFALLEAGEITEHKALASGEKSKPSPVEEAKPPVPDDVVDAEVEEQPIVGAITLDDVHDAVQKAFPSCEGAGHRHWCIKKQLKIETPLSEMNQEQLAEVITSAEQWAKDNAQPVEEAPADSGDEEPEDELWSATEEGRMKFLGIVQTISDTLGVPLGIDDLRIALSTGDRPLEDIADTTLGLSAAKKAVEKYCQKAIEQGLDKDMSAF